MLHAHHDLQPVGEAGRHGAGSLLPTDAHRHQVYQDALTCIIQCFTRFRCTGKYQRARGLFAALIVLLTEYDAASCTSYFVITDFQFAVYYSFFIARYIRTPHAFIDIGNELCIINETRSHSPLNRSPLSSCPGDTPAHILII